ncbi:MAG: molybdate ABC transporter substrate-binding protein [Terriglobales bacterium]
MRARLLTFAAILAVLMPLRASAGQVTVAAASDLSFALPELAAGFEKQSGHMLRVSYGSSGNFFSQIQNGAPFDLYFSADADYPRKLEAAGLTEPGSFYVYAVGRIVLWVPKDSPLDLEHAGMQVLLDPRVRRIAIANPRHAPYGRAAVAAMKSAGVYEKIADKLVLGENISQAAQFVASGNADVGILALSLAVVSALSGQGRYWEIPADSYPRLEQALVILKSAPDPRPARAFLTYLKTPAAAAILRRYGFQIPEVKP